MIKIDNLTFSYTKTAPYVLNNINLTIPNGSYVSILGDNGSGKSTLVKLILNLLKPVNGIIYVHTHNIGYVPQKVEGFNSQFPITVFEVLNTHRKILRIHDTDVVNQCLKAVNMQSFKNAMIGKLSGGQMQKIFIARALIGNPELLILDEPSTGIDIESQKDIYALIKQLNINKKITVIAVEHNLDAAINNSTHIYVLHSSQGNLYTIAEYKHKKLNEKIHICQHFDEEDTLDV